MQNYRLGLLLGSAALLASCGQQVATSAPAATQGTPVQIAQFAQRPELQDAGSQALLRQYAGDPDMLGALKRAYGLAPSLAKPSAQALGVQNPRLNYVQEVAWGTPPHYQAEKANPKEQGLNWTSDGCSAPAGLGLGYRDTFRPACELHDFGYRNLPGLSAPAQWSDLRQNTDQALHSNMDAICAGKSWAKRPPCYVASQAYYAAVHEFGLTIWLSWAPH